MKTKFDDKEMILNPERWPCWPVLPLKHRTKDFFEEDALGFLVDDLVNNKPFQVYLESIYLIPKDGNLAGLKHTTYADLDKLVEDWRVD